MTHRRHRLRPRRARTIRRLARAVREHRWLYPEIAAGYWRPTTRADCDLVARPCLYVSCKHNLYLDVSPATGSIKLNFPDIEPCDMIESCALDVADRGGVVGQVVGDAMNITRERVRQIEMMALGRVKAALREAGLDPIELGVDLLDEHRQLRLLMLPWATPREGAPKREWIDFKRGWVARTSEVVLGCLSGDPATVGEIVSATGAHWGDVARVLELLRCDGVVEKDGSRWKAA